MLNTQLNYAAFDPSWTDGLIVQFATCMVCLLSTPLALIGLSAKTLWVPSLRGHASQMNASLAVGSCWKSGV